jgi:membrane protein DedA with SNARE-associated domain
MNLEQFLDQIFEWITNTFSPLERNVISLSILFVGSVFESFPVIGMFLPMETLTVFFGVLAYKDILDLKLLIIVTFFGMVIGDNISYYIGQKTGNENILKLVKKFKIPEDKYQYFIYLVDNNIIKALFIARSHNVTRWIIPYLAGVHNINFKSFFIANIITGIFWSFTFVLGGYFLGKTFEIILKDMFFAILIIIAAVIFWYFVKNRKN